MRSTNKHENVEHNNYTDVLVIYQTNEVDSRIADIQFDIFYDEIAKLKQTNSAMPINLAVTKHLYELAILTLIQYFQ